MEQNTQYQEQSHQENQDAKRQQYIRRLQEKSAAELVAEQTACARRVGVAISGGVVDEVAEDMLALAEAEVARRLG